MTHWGQVSQLPHPFAYSVVKTIYMMPGPQLRTRHPNLSAQIYFCRPMNCPGGSFILKGWKDPTEFHFAERLPQKPMPVSCFRMPAAASEFGRRHPGLLLEYTVKGAHGLEAGKVRDLRDFRIGMDQLLSGIIGAVDVQKLFEIQMKVLVKLPGQIVIFIAKGVCNGSERNLLPEIQ